MALRHGQRGLPGGSSLAQLLAKDMAVPNRADRPRLSTALILKWADQHHERTSNWPTRQSGPHSCIPRVKHGPESTWHSKRAVGALLDVHRWQS